jgi:hypothetical protein
VSTLFQSLFFHFLDIVLYRFILMWRPATKQITGTNESQYIFIFISSNFLPISPRLVPLGGNRRRFGPAPVEESAPPQLAQPSPSAYPRPRDDGSRTKEDSPSSTGTPSPGKSAAAHLLLSHRAYRRQRNPTSSSMSFRVTIDIVISETAHLGVSH